MKILHVISNLQTGGAQRLLHDLTQAQARQGHAVEVLIFKKKGDFFERSIARAGISLTDIPDEEYKTPLRGIGYIRKRLTDYDIVHVHLFPTLYYVAAANLGIGMPLVYTEHSTHNRRRDHRMLRPLERLVYSRYRAISAISDATAASLAEWIGEKNSRKISIVENGVVLPQPSDLIKTPPAQTQDGEKRILMVSRFVASKDQLTVVNAIPYLRASNAKIYFAGDGETLGQVKAHAAALGVADKCVFLGNVEDIDSLIRTAHIGVQSSHWEGFGLTALEFMSRGVPVIGSRVKGLESIIGKNGLLFETGNPEQLADCIDKVLETPSLYTQMQELGMARAREFSIEATATKFDRLYRNILAL